MSTERNELEKTMMTNNDAWKNFLCGTLSTNSGLSVETIESLLSGDRRFLPETIDPETKTHVYSFNGRIKVALYDNGCLKDYHDLRLPTVKDVEVLNDRVVIVYFDDGTSEKALLSEDDEFNLEQGISICLTKRILSTLSNGNGGTVYNKLIKYCLGVYNKNRHKEKDEEQKQKAAKERRKKIEDKKRKKHERKAQREREAQIEIQKEAYIRAMKELGQ